MEHDKLKSEIRERILAGMDFSKDISDDEMLERIDKGIIDYSREQSISLNEKLRLRKELFYSIRKLDVLQLLVDDSEITEIMVNGMNNIFVEKNGSLYKHELKFESAQKLEDVIQQIVSKCNRVVNEASPIVDARLENGARVNVVLPPVALNGPILTIRRFPDTPITMEKLIEFGALKNELAEYLQTLVKAGYNIFISGGTGSGKTTFLNALSDSIPRDERVITIEDNAELQILHVPNIVRMETRNANVEGCKPITIRDLIKSSLRMRPDRIVIGEVRGDECVDMLQAMNTGHISMSTGHANTARDMLKRLETMFLMGMDLPLSAVRGQIASGIDIIVQLGRLRDRSRKVLEVCELSGKVENMTGEIEIKTLFRFHETGTDRNGKIVGEWRCENELESLSKLEAAGLKLKSYSL